MEKITFKCEIITPMFLGGADGKTPELRPPSIKGALRFWWRALHGDLALEKLKSKETDIFGGTGEGNNAKKSKFRIQINAKVHNKEFSNIPNKIIPISYGANKIQVNIMKYLALGMFSSGKHEKGNFQPDHKYLIPNGIFTLILFIKEEEKADVYTSLKALELFGNLGSKSRNGFGGFRIIECSDEKFKISSDVESFVKDLELKEEDPEYFAFSNGFKILKGTPQDSWENALFETGKAYLKSRITIDKLHHFDNRKYIAFPVNTFKDIVDHFIKNEDRHSKPYSFKVIKDGNHYIPYIFYFPAEYVSGINNLEKYNRVNEKEETKKFLNACNHLNKSLIKQGFKEVKYD